MTGKPTAQPASDETVEQLANSAAALAGEVREHRDQLADRMKGLQDAIDDLRTQVQWLCNNSPDVFRVRSMAADPLDEQWSQKLNRQFCALACTQCDCDAPESLEAALKASWSELMHDDQPGWDYLGLCPDCRQYEEDRVEVTRQSENKQEPENAKAPSAAEIPAQPEKGTNGGDPNFLWKDG